jgi:hypothetical protein
VVPVKITELIIAEPVPPPLDPPPPASVLEGDSEPEAFVVVELEDVVDSFAVLVPPQAAAERASATNPSKILGRAPIVAISLRFRTMPRMLAHGLPPCSPDAPVREPSGSLSRNGDATDSDPTTGRPGGNWHLPSARRFGGPPARSGLGSPGPPAIYCSRLTQVALGGPLGDRIALDVRSARQEDQS